MQPLLCIFESHCHLSVGNIFLSICPSYPSNHTSIKTTPEGINCPLEHHAFLLRKITKIQKILRTSNNGFGPVIFRILLVRMTSNPSQSFAFTGVVRFVRAELSATGRAVHRPSRPRAELSGNQRNHIVAVIRE